MAFLHIYTYRVVTDSEKNYYDMILNSSVRIYSIPIMNSFLNSFDVIYQINLFFDAQFRFGLKSVLFYF